MKIIFLDMDGVMNSDMFAAEEGPINYGAMHSKDWAMGNIDPKAVELLNALVEKSGAHIVISSSWRLIYHFSDIADMLKEKGFKYADRIIDATAKHAEYGEINRGDEIAQWLGMDRERRVVDPEQTPVQQYVIIDDNDEFSSEQHEHFVHTDPHYGLTAQNVRRALQILTT